MCEEKLGFDVLASEIDFIFKCFKKLVLDVVGKALTTSSGSCEVSRETD